MCCDTQGQVHAGEPSGDGFPFVRMLGPIALIGLNSAIHTPPLIAWGRLGAAQLQRLAQVLRRIGDACCFRLVLIHHPPLPGQATPTRGLRDAKELRTLLEAHGAELAVHGHNHTSTLVFCAGPNGPIPVVGAPSGSLGRSRKNEPLARYHLYRIGGPPWSAEMISRGLTEEEGDIVEIDRRQLLPSAVA
jgi:3',5'-cyclic AMP phosphodiesterase CpdA